MKPGWKGNREYLLGNLIRLVEKFINSDLILINPPLFNLDENGNPKYTAVDPMGGPYIGLGMDMGYIHDDLKGLIVESIEKIDDKIILNTKRL
jgi:hypothetical protein